MIENLVKIASTLLTYRCLIDYPDSLATIIING
jgi:hypothetical protein